MSALSLLRYTTRLRVARFTSGRITISVYAAAKSDDLVLHASLPLKDCEVIWPPKSLIPHLRAGDIFIPIEDDDSAAAVEHLLGSAS